MKLNEMRKELTQLKFLVKEMEKKTMETIDKIFEIEDKLFDLETEEFMATLR